MLKFLVRHVCAPRGSVEGLQTASHVLLSAVLVQTQVSVQHAKPTHLYPEQRVHAIPDTVDRQQVVSLATHLVKHVLR